MSVTENVVTKERALVFEDRNGFRVSKEAYLDSRIFDIEMDRIFKREWVFVAHESEIANEGDYKTTYVGRDPVIVTRDEEGTVHVLLNRCVHRGSIVCRYEKGNSHYLRCPYHAWTYDNTGKLIGIAQRHDAYPKDYVPPQGLAKAPRVESYRGFIFASFSTEGPSLLEHLGDARRYIDLQLDRSPVGEVEVRFGAQRVLYRGNWKFQVENLVDGYHGDYVHESFFKVVEKFGNASGMHNVYVGKLGDIRRHRLQRTIVRGFPQGHALWASLATKELVELLRNKYPEFIARLQQLHGERVVDLFGAYNVYIWPNLAVVQGQIRVIRPISVDLTELRYYPLAWKDVPEQYNVERLRAFERFYGPAGFGAPDDVEIHKLNWVGLQGEEGWLVLDRGIHREDGTDAVAEGQGADEHPQRAFWRKWVRVVCGTRGAES